MDIIITNGFINGLMNIKYKDEMMYTNIKGMYNTEHGYGLQLDDRLEGKRENILSVCHEIADSIYKLQETMSN